MLFRSVLILTYFASFVFSFRTHRHLFTADSHGHSTMTQKTAFTLMAVATIVIAYASEVLVKQIEAATQAVGMTKFFVGVIVVAVVGNAAEHSTAVSVAIKNHMDLSLNIAIGSSIQIALFVAPVLVFASYFMPHGPMDLRFTAFEVLSVLSAVGVVNLVAQDGESNWLEGAMLLAAYVVLGLAFFFLP